MVEFKVGDKVRILSAIPELGYKGGEVVTIKGFNYGDTTVIIEGRYPSGGWPTAGISKSYLGPVRPKVKRDYVADHARRTLRAAGLPKDVAAKAVANIAKSGNYNLSEFSRKLPHAASTILGCGFNWRDSPEGQEYWAMAERAQHYKETRNA